MDGSPVRVTAYRIPKDPVKDRWVAEMLDESLHVVHNLWPVPRHGAKGRTSSAPSYEGVSLLSPLDRQVAAHPFGRRQPGKPQEPIAAPAKSNRASSKAAESSWPPSNPGTATRWSFYTEPAAKGELWDRHVLDTELKWAMASGRRTWMATARTNSSSASATIWTRRTGAAACASTKAVDDKGAQWARHIVDSGGVAVEDITAGDLNGDGRIDIVAVGRQTKNIRIYWNEGVAR